MSLENVVKQNLLESPSKRWLNFVRESKKKDSHVYSKNETGNAQKANLYDYRGTNPNHHGKKGIKNKV